MTMVTPIAMSSKTSVPKPSHNLFVVVILSRR